MAPSVGATTRYLRAAATMRDVAQQTAGGAVPTLKGDLDLFLRDFTAASPKRASGVYEVPSDGDRAGIVAAWEALKLGELDRAAGLADAHGFHVLRYTDEPTGRTFDMLAERPTQEGAFSRGWGLYAVDPAAQRPALHVETPHPWDDITTDAMSVDLLRRTGAGVLGFAGASRFALPGITSDAAHASDSIFQAVHTAQAREGATFVQLHGFAQKNHPTFGHAVLSEGALPSGIIERVTGSLQQAGWNAGYYDGTNFARLGGRNNVQGKSARELGADFIHVETVDGVRLNGALRTRFGAALADGVSGAIEATPA